MSDTIRHCAYCGSTAITKNATMILCTKCRIKFCIFYARQLRKAPTKKGSKP